MKRYIKILGIGMAVLSLTACSEDFLEKEPNGYINDIQLSENAKWNPYVMLGQVNGISVTTFAYGTGGTTNHDDFGQKSVDIATDLMSGDMVMAGETYGWFSSDSKLSNSTSTRQRAYSIWRYYYQVIKAANKVFDTVGGDGNMPEEGSANRAYYGQAKVLRAYAYLNLVNLYARPYDVAKDTKVLPYYTSQLTTETLGLSTVDQIYTNIIKDLTEALTALNGYERMTKDEPDTDLANCLLAYTYLQKGEYSKAYFAAMEVISTNKYPLLAGEELLSCGFNSVDISEFIWAIDLNADNTPALPTFWGHVDYFTYSYCAAGDYKMIPDNLYAEIPDSDIRKLWFRNSEPLMNWYKFYDSGRKPMGDRLWENDEVYMRIAEMYLVAAEAAVRNNDLPNAKTVWKEFMQTRDDVVAATIDDMTSETLLENIYYNWRLEMWGEGRGLMTMKRFKKTVTRGMNDFAWPGKNISYDDDRLYFEIPDNEVTNNPNL